MWDFSFRNLQGDDDIITVVIEEGITSVCAGAFAYCNSLESITIPEGVTEIQVETFDDCDSLTIVNLPESLTRIGRKAFLSCSKLESITIPENVIEIADSAFCYCTSLKSVDLPESIVKIGECAFMECGLETLTIPSTVESIGKEAFRNSISESEEYWDETTESYKWTSPNVSISLSSSVTTIKTYAFADNQGLKNVKVYNPETQFGYKVFDNCENLVLHGYDDSTTEAYAEEYGIPFVSLNVTSVEITTLPTKLNYCLGDELELTGMKVKVSYADGTTKYVDGVACEIEGFQSNCAGTQTITTRYGEYTDTFVIEVKRPGVTFANTDVTLKVGEILSLAATTTPSGYNITWYSDNPNVAPVWGTEDGGEIYARQSGYTSITARITYQGEVYSARCDVYVIAPLHISEIEIATLPTKLNYCIGDELDLTGIKVKVSYEDGTTEYVDGVACEIEGFQSNSVGKQTITVRYGEFLDTFTVEVKSPGVTLAKTEVTLQVGEAFLLDAKTTPSGYDVTWYSANSDVVSVWETEESCEMFACQVGSTCITASITYQGETYSARCYVTVKGIELKPVSNLKASLTGYDDVKVSWSSVSGATGYKVYYKKSSSSKYSYLGHTTGTSYSKSNLSDGIKYYFKVIPYYAGEEEIVYAKSKTVSIYTLKKLSTPTVSKYSSSKVTVKWKNIAGESGYQISRSTSKSGTSIVSTYSTTTGASKTISATKGKTYYYKVRAYKLEGSKKIYGPWSSVRSYKVR